MPLFRLPKIYKSVFNQQQLRHQRNLKTREEHELEAVQRRSRRYGDENFWKGFSLLASFCGFVVWALIMEDSKVEKSKSQGARESPIVKKSPRIPERKNQWGDDIFTEGATSTDFETTSKDKE